MSVKDWVCVKDWGGGGEGLGEGRESGLRVPQQPTK